MQSSQAGTGAALARLAEGLDSTGDPSMLEHYRLEQKSTGLGAPTLGFGDEGFSAGGAMEGLGFDDTDFEGIGLRADRRTTPAAGQGDVRSTSAAVDRKPVAARGQSMFYARSKAIGAPLPRSAGDTRAGAGTPSWHGTGAEPASELRNGDGGVLQSEQDDRIGGKRSRPIDTMNPAGSVRPGNVDIASRGDGSDALRSTSHDPRQHTPNHGRKSNAGAGNGTETAVGVALSSRGSSSSYANKHRRSTPRQRRSGLDGESQLTGVSATPPDALDRVLAMAVGVGPGGVGALVVDTLTEIDVRSGSLASQGAGAGAGAGAGPETSRVDLDRLGAVERSLRFGDGTPDASSSLLGASLASGSRHAGALLMPGDGMTSDERSRGSSSYKRERGREREM